MQALRTAMATRPMVVRRLSLVIPTTAGPAGTSAICRTLPAPVRTEPVSSRTATRASPIVTATPTTAARPTCGPIPTTAGLVGTSAVYRTLAASVGMEPASSRSANKASPIVMASLVTAARRLLLVIPTTVGRAASGVHLVSAVLMGLAFARIPYATASVAARAAVVTFLLVIVTARCCTSIC